MNYATPTAMNRPTKETQVSVDMETIAACDAPFRAAVVQMTAAHGLSVHQALCVMGFLFGNYMAAGSVVIDDSASVREALPTFADGYARATRVLAERAKAAH